MERYGISVQVKNAPKLDPEFIPLLKFNQAFLAGAAKPVSIAVERADGQMAACHTKIHGTPEMAQADHYYIHQPPGEDHPVDEGRLQDLCGRGQGHL